MAYPKLEINLQNIKANAKIIKKLCEKNKINLCAVVKVFHADEKIVKALVDEGIKEMASSRTIQLKKIKDNFPSIKTLLIRIPMISELENVIKYADCTLISCKDTILKLNEIAGKNNKKQKVIVMQDLGDLREGIIEQNDLVSLCVYIENSCSNLILEGIGTNLTCYGSIRPTNKNLSVLVDSKNKIEQQIGRKLNIISGGATTSIELLLKNNMPEGINHLRVGGLFTTPNYIKEFLEWSIYLDIKNVFSIKAEIIELNNKPTYPIGEIVVDGFGNKIEYTDLGVRKRAIIALGKNDIGSYLQLYPKDKNIYIIGGSSDHTIIDINDTNKKYMVGDILEFELDYESIMMGMQS